MQPVKDYIKSKLITVGVKNLYDFEQTKKSTLLANPDAGEFFGGTGNLKRNEGNGFSETLSNTTGDEDAVYHDRGQKLEMSVTQQMRLLMKRETLYSRLNQFYALLYNEEAQAGQIARIIELENVTIDGQTTEQEVYYDIVDFKYQEGKEFEPEKNRPKIVEVILTFTVNYGIFQSREGVTIEDFPVELDITEN